MNTAHNHAICQPHNLPPDWRPGPARYGIRIRLPETDPMTRILGKDWEMCRWYPSASERDRALREMTETPPYARRGDRPSSRL